MDHTWITIGVAATKITAMISIEISDVPAYLRGGSFFRSLDEEGSIVVPASYFRTDREWVTSLEDFKHQLQVMRFWMLDTIPNDVMHFCANTDHAIWREAIHEVFDAESKSIVDALEIAFQTPGEVDFNDVLVTQRWDVAEFVLQQMDPANENCKYYTDIIATAGRLDLLILAHQRGFPWSVLVCQYAAARGHLDCLRYAHENGCPWSFRLYIVAVNSGNMSCFYYAHQHGLEWHPHVCTAAAVLGHLSTLQYAHENNCPWDCDVALAATQHGHVDCLRYALDHDAPIDARVCATAVSKYASSPIYLELIHDYGVAWDVLTCDLAAKYSDADCLQYLHENGYPWDERVTAVAAQEGKLDVLQYAMENGCDYSKFLMHSAVRGESLDCLQYLLETQNIWLYGGVFILALLKGNFLCLQYLLDQGCPYLNVKFNGKDYAYYDSVCVNDKDKLLLCIQFAVERGWVLTYHFIYYMLSKDASFSDVFVRQGWMPKCLSDVILYKIKKVKLKALSIL